MSQLLRARTVTVVVVAVLVAFLQLSSARADEPNGSGGEGEPATEQGRPERAPRAEDGFEADPLLIAQEFLITDLQETPQVDVAGPPGTTCSRAPVSSRLTTPPDPGTAHRVAFVYVTPTSTDTGWSDSKLDMPMLCSNGNAWSAMDFMYRNTARFMARELNATTLGPLRLATFTNTYSWSCGVVTCSKALYAGYYLMTSNTVGYINALTPAQKANWLATRLRNAGFDDPNVVYVAIIHARQDDAPSTPEDERETLGAGYRDQRGSAWEYGYALRTLWDGTRYGAARFGCATLGDFVVLHEASHVLGAVPLDAPNGDGAGHMNTNADLMGPRAERTFSSSPAAELDRGTDDYRDHTYGRGYVSTADSSYVTSAYRAC